MLLAQRTLAADLDADGYTTDPSPGRDCNDGNAGIHPNAQEVVGNDVDEDCDNVDAVKRQLQVKEFPLMSWTWTGAVSHTDGEVKIGSSFATTTSSVQKSYAMSLPRGRVHAVLGVSANSVMGPGCTLRIRTATGPTAYGLWSEWGISGKGTGTLTTGDLVVYSAPRTLKEIQITCGATSTVTVDWLTLQNTSDAIPPASEATLAWEDLGMAGGGWTAPSSAGASAAGCCPTTCSAARTSAGSRSKISSSARPGHRSPERASPRSQVRRSWRCGTSWDRAGTASTS